ncbi:MAG: hypothetical protein U0136_04065 [Bdellovibrionota bacterium]
MSALTAGPALACDGQCNNTHSCLDAQSQRTASQSQPSREKEQRAQLSDSKTAEQVSNKTAADAPSDTKSHLGRHGQAAMARTRVLKDYK